MMYNKEEEIPFNVYCKKMDNIHTVHFNKPSISSYISKPQVSEHVQCMDIGYIQKVKFEGEMLVLKLIKIGQGNRRKLQRTSMNKEL